jgi:uncharacterized protein YeaO (DUF488 family)
MLQAAPIRSPRTQEDGLRISIMSRHTLNDGKTPDPTISRTMYDEWWPELAPPASLIGDYYKRNLSWDDFSKKFIEYLNDPVAADSIQRLGEFALVSDATVLCTETTPERCHRRLVAERCKLLFPELEVCIK